MVRRPENPHWSGFKLAVGLRPGFRRTGPATLINIAVAAGVGAVSGYYIFKEPLDDYWRKKQIEEAGQPQTVGQQPAGRGGKSGP